MRRKKANRTSRKQSNHKLLLFVLGLIIIAAIGFFTFKSLASSKNKIGIASTNELTAIDRIYSAVSNISLSTDGAENCANQLGGNDLIFASSYTVSCFSESSPVARTAPGANCQSSSSILADAKSFCESRRPTPTLQTSGGVKPPLPCRVSGAGDVDFDGYVTNKDVTLVQEFAVSKKTPTSSQLLRADINGTKTISAADLSAISAYSLGKITTFPVCGITPTPTYTPNNPWKTPTPTLPKPTSTWGATPKPTTSACAAYGSNYSTYCSGNNLREKYSNGSCGSIDNLVQNCSNGCTKVTSTDAKCS